MATRWGIVTAGNISHDFVSAVRTLPEDEHKIVAVAARNLDRAQEFASLHNIPKAYGSYEDLAKDDSVEVVYIATINTQHLPIGKMMLEAKKHVLMEKPMTMNLKQTKELINIAKENNCFLMEALWSRFMPAFKQLSEELSKKTIGDVLYVSANFGFPAVDIGILTKKSLGGGALLGIGIYTINAVCMAYEGEMPQRVVAVGHCNEEVWSRFVPAYKQLSEELSKGTVGDVLHVSANFGIPASDVERLTAKSLGGGTVLDLGIYTINAVCMAYESEKPQKIAAVGHCNEEGVDLGISASLLYSNGRMATIATSSQVQLPCDLVICGTKGQLKIPNNFWCGTKLITPNKTYEFVLPETAVPCNYINSSGLRYEACEVRECLQKGLLESPTMKHSDSELLASIMDEIRRQVGVVYPEDG